MNLLVRISLFLPMLLFSSCTSPVHGFFPPSITITKAVDLLDFPKVRLLSVRGTKTEIQNTLVAVEWLNRVYRSPCFEREVISRIFTETDGMNSQEVFNQLRSDITKIHLSFYTGSFIENRLFGVIGYVRPNIPDTIFQNRFFIKTPSDVARNLIHEIAHLWGFSHYQIFASTVPYQMNQIWDVCSEELGID